MGGEEREGREQGWKKEDEKCHVCAPIPNKACEHYVLHMCTNKYKNNLKEFIYDGCDCGKHPVSFRF